MLAQNISSFVAYTFSPFCYRHSIFLWLGLQYLYLVPRGHHHHQDHSKQELACLSPRVQGLDFLWQLLVCSKPQELTCLSLKALGPSQHLVQEFLLLLLRLLLLGMCVVITTGYLSTVEYML